MTPIVLKKIAAVGLLASSMTTIHAMHLGSFANVNAFDVQANEHEDDLPVSHNLGKLILRYADGNHRYKSTMFTQGKRLSYSAEKAKNLFWHYVPEYNDYALIERSPRTAAKNMDFIYVAPIYTMHTYEKKEKDLYCDTEIDMEVLHDIFIFETIRCSADIFFWKSDFDAIERPSGYATRMTPLLVRKAKSETVQIYSFACYVFYDVAHTDPFKTEWPLTFAVNKDDDTIKIIKAELIVEAVAMNEEHSHQTLGSEE